MHRPPYHRSINPTTARPRIDSLHRLPPHPSPSHALTWNAPVSLSGTAPRTAPWKRPASDSPATPTALGFPAHPKPAPPPGRRPHTRPFLPRATRATHHRALPRSPPLPSYQSPHRLRFITRTGALAYPLLVLISRSPLRCEPGGNPLLTGPPTNNQPALLHSEPSYISQPKPRLMHSLVLSHHLRTRARNRLGSP